MPINTIRNAAERQIFNIKYFNPQKITTIEKNEIGMKIVGKTQIPSLQHELSNTVEI